MGTLSPEALQHLRNHADEWKKADPDSDLPPDGEYVACLEGFDFFAAKDGPHEFMKTIMSVADGPQKGSPIEMVHIITDPAKFKFLRRHLAGLGLDLDDPGELLNVINGAGHRFIDVTVKTSDRINETTGKPYRNAYANGVSAFGQSDLGSLTVPAGGGGGAADDDIPFRAAQPTTVRPYHAWNDFA